MSEEEQHLDYCRGMLLLGLHDWPAGWDLVKRRNILYTQYERAKTLDDVRDKTVLLFAERGLGDNIMFARYALLLKPLVKHLIIAVPRTLIRLMQCLDPDIEVTRIESYAPRHDIAVAMMDCPALFATTLATIPHEVPYFTLPAKQHEFDRPLIGLCWAGGHRPNSRLDHEVERFRSMAFADIKPLLDLSDRMDFVSLQEPEFHVEDARLGQPIDFDADFLSTATVMQELDLVITVDTSIAHLAGALNKPVWLLLHVDSDWRWFWGPPDAQYHAASPWYPSMRIFRATAEHDWSSVIAAVAAALR